MKKRVIFGSRIWTLLSGITILEVLLTACVRSACLERSKCPTRRTSVVGTVALAMSLITRSDKDRPFFFTTVNYFGSNKKDLDHRKVKNR